MFDGKHLHFGTETKKSLYKSSSDRALDAFVGRRINKEVQVMSPQEHFAS